MNRDRATAEALRMLETFVATGAEHFDLTLTTRKGEKARFRRQVTAEYLRRTLPELLSSSVRIEQNVIIRPTSRNTTFIQLDDLGEEALHHVEPVAFLGLKTSVGNHQAWIAMPAGADKDFARRLRKGTCADPTASGATRLAGSLNFKDKYAPDFPRVEITHHRPGLVVSPERLEALGLLAPPEPAQVPPARVSRRHRRGAHKWPDYTRCLEHAPLAYGDDRPDVSRADFTWCMVAIDWGFGTEETAAKLMQESQKARENGEAYALRTAERAAAAVERRQGPKR